MTIEQSQQQIIAYHVRQLRQRYIADRHAPSYYAINDGICDQFADELARILEPVLGKRVYVVEGAGFTLEGEGDVWDEELLAKHWNIAAPAGWTWAELNAINFGAHIWVTVDDRHYDAECPEGVDSFFDLPLYRRCLVYDLRERGIACDEVVVDDVIPPPMCPIPNPVKEAA